MINFDRTKTPSGEMMANRIALRVDVVQDHVTQEIQLNSSVRVEKVLTGNPCKSGRKHMVRMTKEQMYEMALNIFAILAHPDLDGGKLWKLRVGADDNWLGIIAPMTSNGTGMVSKINRRKNP